MKDGLFRSYFGAICVPQIDKGDGTISSVTHDWANAMSSVGGGLAVTVLRLNIRNRSVGQAKQAMAEMAVASGCQWAFFVDDDVLVPGDALMKMIQRWRMDPQKYAIQNGVYWSKSEPPQPLIFKGSFEGSFWNWHVGDLLEADAAGAGCTFIATDVFKKMPKPWFSTEYIYNDQRENMDLEQWQMESDLVDLLRIPNRNKEQEIKIKELQREITKHSDLMRQMLETGGLDPKQMYNVQPAGSTTEDLYFYKKAKEYLDLSCWVDTSIQCGHQDKRTGRIFGMRDDFPQAKPSREIPQGKKGLLLDVGCGEYGPHFQDYEIVRLDLDPTVQPDIVADARQIPEPDGKYDVIYASHVLEHFGFKWTVNILKEWIRVLKVGGKLVITVPNLEWAAEKILQAKDGKIDQFDKERAMFMFFSAQKDGGAEDYHKAGFTPKSLESLLKSIDLLTDVKIETSNSIWSTKDEYPGNYNIIATATKIKHNAPTSIHKNLALKDQEEIKYVDPNRDTSEVSVEIKAEPVDSFESAMQEVAQSAKPKEEKRGFMSTLFKKDE